MKKNKKFLGKVAFVKPADLGLTPRPGRAHVGSFAVQTALSKSKKYGAIPRGFSLSQRDEQSPRVKEPPLWEQFLTFFGFGDWSNFHSLHIDEEVLVGVYE